MSKRQWLSLLGVWVIIFLFLGFPAMWHEIIAVITGIIIIVISYSLPAENITQSTMKDLTFIDNKVNKSTEEIKKKSNDAHVDEEINSEIK